MRYLTLLKELEDLQAGDHLLFANMHQMELVDPYCLIQKMDRMHHWIENRVRDQVRE